MLDINSAEEYGDIVVQILKETQPHLPVELLEYWCEEVHSAAINSYSEYIVGIREDYLLNTDEVDKCYEVAGLKYTEGLLNSLVDEDFITASINNTGEITYSEVGKLKKKKKR